VSLEAMASKKPVVGTSVGGTPEIIIDGKTGYIVPPRNIAALSEKIIYLLQHQDIAKQFGEEGYKRVQEKFHITQHCDQILKVYEQAIQ
jgi:glycosyltransferase involved in cell wall biosynthesis